MASLANLTSNSLKQSFSQTIYFHSFIHSVIHKMRSIHLYEVPWYLHVYLYVHIHKIHTHMSVLSTNNNYLIFDDTYEVHRHWSKKCTCNNTSHPHTIPMRYFITPYLRIRKMRHSKVKYLGQGSI